MIASLSFADWGVVAGLVIASPVVVALVWAILRAGRHLGLVHEAIAGREATAVSDEIPSMIKRFQTVNQHLADQDSSLKVIKKELFPNGGSSLRDKVDSLAAKVDDHIVADTLMWNKIENSLDGLTTGQSNAHTREGAIAGTAVRTAAALHTETVDTAAGVADLALQTASDLDTKLHPAKKAAVRKRTPAKKARPE